MTTLANGTKLEFGHTKDSLLPEWTIEYRGDTDRDSACYRVTRWGTREERTERVASGGVSYDPDRDSRWFYWSLLAPPRRRWWHFGWTPRARTTFMEGYAKKTACYEWHESEASALAAAVRFGMGITLRPESDRLEFQDRVNVEIELANVERSL